MNHLQRGQQMAQEVADIAGRADQVVLAQYSAEDYPSVIAAGHVTCRFEEYQQRLAGAIATFEQQGQRVIVVPTTAQELTDTIAENGLPRTEYGRAAAIGIIHTRRRLP